MRGLLTRRTFVAGTAAAILARPRTGFAQASDLPRTITLHVGFPAGGPADIIARLVAERLGAAPALRSRARNPVAIAWA